MKYQVYVLLLDGFLFQKFMIITDDKQARLKRKMIGRTYTKFKGEMKISNSKSI